LTCISPVVHPDRGRAKLIKVLKETARDAGITSNALIEKAIQTGLEAFDKFNAWQRKRGDEILSRLKPDEKAIVVVGILGLIGTVVIRGMNTNYQSSRLMDEQVTAENLATAYIEAIRSIPYAASYPSAGNNITMPAQYSVNITVWGSSDTVNYVPAIGSANNLVAFLAKVVLECVQ
jgi:hypothetical protein